ncbi:MAG: PAS domain S-box protein [Candidatus Methanoperedens sp.]|nr:PAS domain S-box protein [Candidatus Methanoperedens sp.]
MLIIFGAATIIFTSTILKKELENRLISREKLGLEVLESRIFPYIANKDYVTVTSILFEEKEIKKESIYYIVVYDKNKNIISHTFLNEIPEHVKYYAQDTGDFFTTEFRINDVPVIEMTTVIREGAYEVGHLSIGYKKDYIDNIVSQIIGAIVNIIVVLMIFSIILSLFLSTFIVKPVRELSKGMEEVSKGNLSHKLEVASKDEIGELANAFNKMAEDLEKSHNELQESEKRYRMLFESAGDGIFILDAEGEETGRIVAANQAAADMHGYTVNELLTLNITDLDTPEAAREAPDRIRRMLNGERIKTEITHRKKDGAVFPVEISAGLLELGNHKYIFAIDRDITLRKQAEEEIKKYARELEESNRMKDLFTDIMHHDLMNPLNIAKGYAELLREVETDSQKAVYVETIERNMVKGIDLMESTTLLSRLESLESIEFKEMDLREVIAEVIENLGPLATGAQMTIENNITQSMPARANKIIEEVFVNLISNAVKYAPAGKRIIVDGEEKGDCWRIRVVDFGEGIKDAYKDMIFERFRRKEKKGVKGSGLGLAIAGKIMELHKGRIWVEDNPGGGAIFVVEIPKL